MQALMMSAVLAAVALKLLDLTHALDPAHSKRAPLFSDSKFVRTLNISSYEAMLNDTHIVWLLDFYSPFCPHCLRFGPQWEEVAKVYGKVDSIQLGAIDCTRQNEICDREGVLLYPGVKMYHVPPNSKESIDMPHDNNVYARHIASWIEETLKENGMGPLINVDQVYPKNSMRSGLKKTYNFGDPVEPLYDENSMDTHLKRLRDAGATALLTFEDGFYMGTTELAGERYEAALTWVQTLSNAFPLKENQAALALLLDMIKQQNTWRQMDWNTMLEKWKGVANAMSYPTKLFASKDDLSLCATHTCGLWTLFHSLTVNADRLQPSKVMNAILLVVKHFFGCEECRHHFLKANPDSIAKKLALADEDGSHAVIFWMWLMHNNVNRNLGKPRWPTNVSCPNCYFAMDQPQSLDSTQLNMDDIVAYVRSVYKYDDTLKVDQLSIPSSSWNNKSIPAVALLIVSFIVVILQQKYRLVRLKALKSRTHIA